jgi:hypothetical protein
MDSTEAARTGSTKGATGRTCLAKAAGTTGLAKGATGRTGLAKAAGTTGLAKGATGRTGLARGTSCRTGLARGTANISAGGICGAEQDQNGDRQRRYERMGTSSSSTSLAMGGPWTSATDTSAGECSCNRGTPECSMLLAKQGEDGYYSCQCKQQQKQEQSLPVDFSSSGDTQSTALWCSQSCRRTPRW